MQPRDCQDQVPNSLKSLTEVRLTMFHQTMDLHASQIQGFFNIPVDK